LIKSQSKTHKKFKFGSHFDFFKGSFNTVEQEFYHVQLAIQMRFSKSYFSGFLILFDKKQDGIFFNQKSIMAAILEILKGSKAI